LPGKKRIAFSGKVLLDFPCCFMLSYTVHYCGDIDLFPEETVENQGFGAFFDQRNDRH